MPRQRSPRTTSLLGRLSGRTAIDLSLSSLIGRWTAMATGETNSGASANIHAFM